MGDVLAHDPPLDPPLEEWADRLEALLEPGGVIGRIAVVAQTDSTQDAAARLVGDGIGNGVGNARAVASPRRSSAGNGTETGAGNALGGGLMLIAGRQVAGRGRLGRAWADTRGLGLAVTFAIDGRLFDDGFLALAAGLAAQRTAEDALMKTARDDRPIGLRWPNDVVERGAGGRKLAGVLVERKEKASGIRDQAPGKAKSTGERGPSASAGSGWDGSPICPPGASDPDNHAPESARPSSLALIGIGMNVRQESADWPETLRPQAVSLRQLGSTFTRLMVAERLLFRLERSFAMAPDRLARAWRKRSTLSGHVCTFEHNGERYTGRVMSIEPTSEIVLETEGGEVCLPALSTSLVRG